MTRAVEDKACDPPEALSSAAVTLRTYSTPWRESSKKSQNISSLVRDGEDVSPGVSEQPSLHMNGSQKGGSRGLRRGMGETQHGGLREKAGWRWWWWWRKRETEGVLPPVKIMESEAGRGIECNGEKGTKEREVD
ncbi:hypothetical protein EYF80_031410 [Liparis tanakae]|uniref:Uncharacterized protein n=1 Tax=Liparis tanakae TaxID=230148 RepID=A0A4Z2GY78_9TELE|nr:hypothetical protein EYF80_031410 [Liparis tanakae]